MTKFAQFNSLSSQPALVIGWLDTDEFDYPNLPAQSELITLTDAEWYSRMNKEWCVSGGKLVIAPQPTAIEISAKTRTDRIAQIKLELEALDFKKIRPLAEGDTTYLATLNAETATLRAELAAL